MKIIEKIKKELHINQIKPLNNKVYLSIAAIIKNEAPYLKEWIEYHKLLGVERFYIYDNNSDDDTIDVLKQYIKNGDVVYKLAKGKTMQMPAYKDAIYCYGNNTEWMAFIDLDEFIVPVEKDTISEFLKEYERFPSLAINWLLFDYNKHETKPEGLVIENYTRTDYGFKDNIYVKCIVRPREVIDIKTAHAFVFKHNRRSVDSNYNVVKHSTNKNYCIDKIRINHYYTKSKEEYLKRIAKGNVFYDRNREFNKERFDFGVEHDTLVIDKYLKKLKNLL